MEIWARRAAIQLMQGLQDCDTNLLMSHLQNPRRVLLSLAQVEDGSLDESNRRFLLVELHTDVLRFEIRRESPVMRELAWRHQPRECCSRIQTAGGSALCRHRRRPDRPSTWSLS